MSSYYDNWEKLVSAVVKKQQLWKLFHEQSRSPSLTSESDYESSSSGDSFSFWLNSFGSEDFSIEFGAIFGLNCAGSSSPPANNPSSILDVPVVPTGSPVEVKTVPANRTRKLSLVVEVPKSDLNQQAALLSNTQCSPSPSPGFKSSESCISSCRSDRISPNSIVISPAKRISSTESTPTHRTKSPSNHVSSSRSPSPRTTSPVFSPRVHTDWPNDGKQVCHLLPLPPSALSTYGRLGATSSPTVPCNPGRVESSTGIQTTWKKGKLLDRGTFGYVYLGFCSQSGKMCAMKEVILHPEDRRSKKSIEKLVKEIAVLSSLKHPNIVQIYGSETLNDKLYIYSEFLSAGTLYDILKKYGKLGESAIRKYTKQILAGLIYLHSKNIVHRDINGANMLVEPNGSVKLANSGVAKHIIKEFGPSKFDGIPYWTAPEVALDSNLLDIRSDIWSLGCIVLEMATSKPPWSQYEWAAVMFKIAHSKELPVIPDFLSEEGKEFVRLCLQRNPLHRPTATKLLEHPFVKSGSPRQAQVHSYGVSHIHSGDIYAKRNVSQPASPIVTQVLHSRFPQHPNEKLSPSVSNSNIRPPTKSSSPRARPAGIGFYDLPKSPPRPNCSNSPSYWDANIVRGRVFKLP